MSLKEDIEGGIAAALTTDWIVRDGRVVPEPKDVALKNGAVRLDATYAYADLANSSRLAQYAYPEVTAKIVRSYVNTAARIFRGYGGEIRSFDGDRVMAIFTSDQKEAQSVGAAFALNWAVDQVVNPAIRATWSDLPQVWTMSHAVGVASGQALIVRGGVYGDNDMISIGAAPNIAAKLSDIRAAYSQYITEDVYLALPNALRFTDVRGYVEDMWVALGRSTIGGTDVLVRGSTWWWSP